MAQGRRDRGGATNIEPKTLAVVVVALLIWASAFAGIRAGLVAYGPGEVALLRFGTASIVLAVYATVKRMRLPALRDVPVLALSGFLGWDVVYTSNAVTLAVVPALLGDYNVNGIVDAADYIVWRKTLSQSGNALAADGNRSGTIDPGDYDIWRAQFGQSLLMGSGAAGSSAPSLSANVPEPQSALLLMIVAVEVYFRARRS